MKKRIGLYIPVVMAFLVFGLFLSSARAAEGRAGVVYGADHVFAIKAPMGWMLDSKSGAPNGIYAVFHPISATWRESRAVMYINTTRKNTEDKGGGALLGFIASDVFRLKEGSPGIVVADSPSLTTKDGKTALVRTFTGDKWNNYEAVAYIDEPTIVVMIVLSSWARESFDSAFHAFRELVASYEFMSASPDVEKLKELEKELEKKDFDARVKAAEDAKLTKEGKAYGISLGPAIGTIMRHCLPPMAPPFRDSFTMVADVLRSGTASSVEVRPENDVSRCFAEGLKEERLPAPPSSHGPAFPITLTIKVTP